MDKLVNELSYLFKHFKQKALSAYVLDRGCLVKGEDFINDRYLRPTRAPYKPSALVQDCFHPPRGTCYVT